DRDRARAVERPGRRVVAVRAGVERERCRRRRQIARQEVPRRAPRRAVERRGVGAAAAAMAGVDLVGGDAEAPGADAAHLAVGGLAAAVLLRHRRERAPRVERERAAEREAERDRRPHRIHPASTIAAPPPSTGTSASERSIDSGAPRPCCRYARTAPT